MTDVTPAEEAPAENEEATWSPFPDQDAAVFDVQKPLNEAQLHAELEQALDTPVQLSTSQAPGDSSSTLWLIPGDVDRELVENVIDEHEANPEWGVPSTTRNFLALVRKLRDDDEYELTPEELQTAVKGLILRVQGA